jgi:hypothetical protein
MAGKLVVDFKTRQPVPGPCRDLNQSVIFDIRERQLRLYPFYRLSHAPERTDLHLEQLVIIVECVAEQASNLVRLFNAPWRQG